MEYANESSSCLSVVSTSYLSNGSRNQCIPSWTGEESQANVDLLSLSRLSGNLEKLVTDAEYDYSDVEIEVEGIVVGVNQCILAARSQFFHELFKKGNRSDKREGKPRYVMSDLVQHGKVGYEAFIVFLHYLYSGKIMPSPQDVSTCVDEICAHDACLPAINYAVELMYASATFLMKELVLLVQRRLLNFVDKACAEDVIPILRVAYHCQLSQLLSNCIDRVARSDLDKICLEKELPHEILCEVKSVWKKSRQDIEPDEPDAMEANSTNDKKIKRIHKALDSDDVELVKLLLEESDVTLDAAYALHYSAAYCDHNVVNEVLNLNMANLNLQNYRGYTALHVAARRKEPLILVALLDKGASVSDTTPEGLSAVTICRRLTRPKDYHETTEQGKESNKDRLCIDVLEREMLRNPFTGNMSISSFVAADDLLMRLLLLENRVAMARMLFPREARLAMQIAHADSTSEFAGLSASKNSTGNLREVDLNEIPSDQIKRLEARLHALQRTVETGRRFFPNCSEVLDRLLEDDMNETLLLEKGSPEEQRRKKMRYMELKEEVMKAFDKDKAGKNWAELSASSSSSSSPKSSVSNSKPKKRWYDSPLSSSSFLSNSTWSFFHSVSQCHACTYPQ